MFPNAARKLQNIAYKFIKLTCLPILALSAILAHSETENTAGPRRNSAYDSRSSCESALTIGHYNLQWLASSIKRQQHSVLSPDRLLHLRNEEIFKLRINQIVKVIKASVKKLPDIFVFSEIQDYAAATALAKELGYSQLKSTFAKPGMGSLQVVMVRTDTGAKIIRSRELPVVVPGQKSVRRPVLEVEISKGGRDFLVYANHWASIQNTAEVNNLNSPAVAAQIEAARVQKAAMQEQLSRRPNLRILSIGDFNVDEEGGHKPAFEIMTQPNQSVRLVDAHTHYLELLQRLSPEQAQALNIVDGTSYFRGRWTVTDRLFMSSSLINGEDCIQISMQDYFVGMPDFVLEERVGSPGFVPRRFLGSYGSDKEGTFDREGSSDHVPVFFAFDTSKCD